MEAESSRFCFETRSCYVARVGLSPPIFLLSPPEWRSAPSRPAQAVKLTEADASLYLSWSDPRNPLPPLLFFSLQTDSSLLSFPYLIPRGETKPLDEAGMSSESLHSATCLRALT